MYSVCSKPWERVSPVEPSNVNLMIDVVSVLKPFKPLKLFKLILLRQLVDDVVK